MSFTTVGNVGQMECSYQSSIGCELPFVRELRDTIETMSENAFEFCVMPLVHPRYRRRVNAVFPRDTPFTRSDMILSSQEWSTRVVGKISEWINCDSEERSDSTITNTNTSIPPTTTNTITNININTDTNANLSLSLQKRRITISYSA